MVAFFRRKPDPCDPSASGALAPLIVQVSAHQAGVLMETWKRQLDDRTQVALFEEYVVVLVAVTDRIVYHHCGDPSRRAIMDHLISTIGTRFLSQVGATPQTQAYLALTFQERMFSNGESFAKYAACTSIMGDPIETSIPFVAARHFVETFAVPDPAESVTALASTFKVVAGSLTALFATEPYRSLLKRS